MRVFVLLAFVVAAPTHALAEEHFTPPVEEHFTPPEGEWTPWEDTAPWRVDWLYDCNEHSSFCDWINPVNPVAWVGDPIIDATRGTCREDVPRIREECGSGYTTIAECEEQIRCAMRVTREDAEDGWVCRHYADYLEDALDVVGVPSTRESGFSYPYSDEDGHAWARATCSVGIYNVTMCTYELDAYNEIYTRDCEDYTITGL